MLPFVPLLLAASVAVTDDAVLADGFEIPFTACSATISSPYAARSLLMHSYVTYGVQTITNRPWVWLVEWDNIWGYSSAADTHRAPWPGVNGAGPVIREFGRYNYVGAHFNTGPNSANKYGYFIYPTNVGGPNIDLRISQTCGDFSDSPANPACSVPDKASDGSPTMRWWVKQGNVNTYCNLQPNTDYYLNIRFTNPSSTVECRASETICPVYLEAHSSGG
ncbi:hypothetical protein [Dokdonella sp.]|uniref:hypothetical protein n=1 Tax=Dokdonella sp. TaxID=2291710 RepID=UPI001B0EB4EE|nr:hypothetical protein [Dokdonella sp.]MBO9665098.1 hypothetical protein [Dokdonella sp.]